MRKLGILVVGLSPRPEVEDVFEGLLPDVEIDLRGCLDGLGSEEIASLEPTQDEAALFTRLPDGSGVTLSKSAVVHHGTAQLDRLEASGSEMVVILCTGDFPLWTNRSVLFPSKILPGFVFGLQPVGQLGVLVPLPSQVAEAEARWSAQGHRVTVFALSPNATPPEASSAGLALADAAPDLLVFDCISYTRQIKRTVCTQAHLPGVLAITAVARSAAELMDRGDAHIG